MESNLKKCSRCKKNYDLEHYTKGTKILKRCITCRNAGIKNQIKNKCIHGKRKARCSECGGSDICQHNRDKHRCRDCGGSDICQHNREKYSCRDCGGTGICHHNKSKSQCRDCGGSAICIHNKFKTNCRDCGGSAICIHNKFKPECKECKNPIHITIKRMIYSSKANDIKYNRYDELNYVNYDYLKNLILESNDRCCYCQCEIQYKYYTDNLGTIERLNNNIGHNIGNCKIACRKCNYSKIGSTINPQF